MGLAKKLEGNPKSPVNQGKLCARGQAGLQVLYHPERITHPIKRTGARGSGAFQAISWDDALKELASHLTALQSSKAANALAFLARPLTGQRRELIEKFLKAFGAPPAVWYEPFDEAVLRQANLLSFGHAALPTFELGRADYIISFGADFLGTWNSPVVQSIRISNEIIAIHVEPENHAELLREDWERYVEKPFVEAGADPPQLTILPSPYRLVIVPIVQYVLQLSEKHPQRRIVVVIPQLVEDHWYEYFLHNQRGRLLAWALLAQGNQRIFALSSPCYLSDKE